MFSPAHLFFLMLGTILGLLVNILPGLVVLPAYRSFCRSSLAWMNRMPCR